VSADDGGRGFGPASRCVFCGDMATVFVALNESVDTRGVEDAERYVFSYRLCDRCRRNVAPDELAAAALPDEDGYERGPS
jgi:hypothetical protein